MQPRRALGKGLASLIPSEVNERKKGDEQKSIQEIDVNAIIPNRLQPRRNFSEESLKELSESIRIKGIVQPLIVTPPVNGRYELIAGERRHRAAIMAGLEKVPVVIMDADPEAMLELAIIENIQREDLNSIEEAMAYKELIETFDFTQEEVADKVCKSRPHVANCLRLLFLPKVIQEDIVVGRLSPGHARALLAVSDLQEQLKIRETILNSRLTVRDVEKLIQDALAAKPGAGKDKKKAVELSPQMKAVLNEMTQTLGTKVKIMPHKNNKGGRIVLEYYSLQDLNRIYNRIVTNN